MRNNLIGLIFLILSCSSVQAHDPYTDFKNYEGISCCGGYDCHLLSEENLRINEDGTFEVREDGEWFLVPEPHILRDQSPDGQAHSCPSRYDPEGGFNIRAVSIRCLILPRIM